MKLGIKPNDAWCWAALNLAPKSYASRGNRLTIVMRMKNNVKDAL